MKIIRSELPPFKGMLSNTTDTTLYDFPEINTKMIYEVSSRQIYLIRSEDIATCFFYLTTDITKCSMIPQTMAVDRRNYNLSEPLQMSYPNTKYYTMGTRNLFNSQLSVVHMGESCTYNDLTLCCVDTSVSPYMVAWYKFNGRIQAEFCPETSFSNHQQLSIIEVTDKTANSAAFAGFTLQTAAE